MKKCFQGSWNAFLASIEIFKSLCTSVIYIIARARASSEAKIRACPRSGPRFGLGKPKVVEPDTLGASLPCAGPSLGAESLSSLLRKVNSCKKFLQSRVILERNGETLSFSKWAGYTIKYKAFKIVIERN